MKLRPSSFAPIATAAMVAVLTLIARPWPACHGESPRQSTAGETPTVLKFRRVYAPVDRRGQWPGFKGKHIPFYDNPMDAAKSMYGLVKYAESRRRAEVSS